MASGVSRYVDLDNTAYTAASGDVVVPNVLKAPDSHGYWALCWSVSAASIPLIRANAVNMPLNNNVALANNCLGTAVFNIKSGTTFSIRFSADCTINQLTLEFVAGDVR